MKNVFIWVAVTMLALNTGYAQCDEELYKNALIQAGTNIVLVRDFKVKLREGNKRNPSPANRTSVLMQNGLTYRFSITKDKNSDSEPVLQLFDNNQLIGSTFDPNLNKSLDMFDYLCTRTDNYEVTISMREAKAGCTVGIMAMVTDSAFFAQGNKTLAEELNTLYAGVEMPLDYITNQPEVSKVSITSERGEIIKKDSKYYVLIPTPGDVKINIKLYNKKDSILEDADQIFKVIPLPEPKFKISGMKIDNFHYLQLDASPKLEVYPSVYNILEFSIDNITSTDEYLKREMIERIQWYGTNLNPYFYIKNIRIQKPDGTNLIINQLKCLLK